MFIAADFSPSAFVIPVSVENPTGQNPRKIPAKTSLYTKIKSLRNQCRAQERAALDTDDNKQLLEQWKSITELAATLLREQAKDLEVSAWLIEGLTRLYGFEGLSTGFEIAHVLVEKFWPMLYPRNEETAEDDSQTTLAALAGLNGERNTGTLITPINCIPLLHFNDIPLASWQYQQASRPSSIAPEETDNSLTLEHFQQAAVAAGWQPLKTLKQHIQQAINTFEKLCALLDEKCGVDHSPPRSNIRNTLQENLTIVEALQQFAPEPPAIENATNCSESSEKNSPLEISLTRQKAFHDMQTIANYFRQHEPNSPIPFLLEQAIRWGNLSLPDLLSELVPDEHALLHSYKLIGARK